MSDRKADRAGGSLGQATVEFALAASVFLLVVMAIFDFGRAIFMYNGVSQAAREIARTTSVHPGSVTFGSSQDTAETIKVQKALVPNMKTPVISNNPATADIDCVDAAGTPKSGDLCVSGQDFVRVTVSAAYSPVTPILNFLGSFNLSSSSTIRLPK